MLDSNINTVLLGTSEERPEYREHKKPTKTPGSILILNT